MALLKCWLFTLLLNAKKKSLTKNREEILLDHESH